MFAIPDANVDDGIGVITLDRTARRTRDRRMFARDRVGAIDGCEAIEPTPGRIFAGEVKR